METILEILADVNFSEWRSESQRALASLIDRQASGRSTEGIVGQTDTVWTTFIRILNTHLRSPSEGDLYTTQISRCGGALVARIRSDQEARFPHWCTVEVRRVNVVVVPVDDPTPMGGES